MWDTARKQIESTFFKDTVAIYELTFIQNEIGEDIKQRTLIGTFPSNVENGQSSVNSTVSGESAPQSLRISTLKSVPLDYDKTYELNIIQARISFDPNQVYKVDGWTEAQLSTVITVSREVAV